ncbi:MAG TPA: bifunctional homocysteine S-methyltransferase/methylenetetrahydrofolate reductase [Anaerolineae bacterium]|nr:bifunctional homocysteine S-methyltransferase/methylenetetrahydrofolate reductase [Anaerolineae bacterium]HQH39054.1 bifunctional homocysteine S-methyltransferase/methylenetetrahydrofolate reductase [Anaerolineae bacterium]
MAKTKLLNLIESSPAPVLTDGAMGTMLHGHGVPFGTCFDELNLSRPALVGDIHRAYIEAGAQIILTNTFGANPCKLAAHGLEDKLTAINRAGVDLARRVVAASFKDVLVAGDIGPLGVRLAPFGRVTKEQARDAFAVQIAPLVEAGVDLLVIETFSDVYEVLEALNAARALCDLPVVASMTFTRDDRTLLGDSPAKVARRLWEAGAAVVGVNCSGGPAQLVRLVQQMKEAVPEGRFWVKPNAGWPEQVGGRIMYPATPEYFGEYAWAFCQAGADLIGGCCGTTPAHIAAIRAALDAGPPVVCAPLERAATLHPVHAGISPDRPSCLSQKLGAGQFVLAVEMDPPRGLSTHKLLAGATLLAEAGADVINVADSPMARMRMSPWAVCALIQDEVGIEATLHFPTRGRNLLRVQGDLLAAHVLGIRNVFVVMGDPTSIGDYPEAMDNYDVAPTGLIELIKKGFNVGIDHAGADIGQPTTFFVGAALNLTPTEPENEMKVLRRKLRAGADFFLTQPVYDPAAARAFLDRYAEKYGPLDKPILVGVLPLYGVKHARFLHNEVPGITIAPEFFDRLEAAGADSPSEGVRIALELIAQMRDWAGGIYLMPAFSRYDLAAEIVEAIHQI